MFEIGVVTDLSLIAQSIPDGGLTGALAVYGPFAPFALLLLYILKVLWADNREKDKEIKHQTDITVERILPAVIEATRVVGNAVDILPNAVNEMESQLKDLQRLITSQDSQLRTLQDILVDLRSENQTPNRSRQR